MGEGDQPGPRWGRSLSRRGVLRLGVVATLAAGASSESVAADRTRPPTAVQAQNRDPGQVWTREVETRLDTRVAVLDDPGVALAWSDLLSEEADRLYAFDLATGEPLWDRPLDGPPALSLHDGVLYRSEYGPLSAIDPRSGELLWGIGGTFDHPAHFDGTDAAFSGDLYRATVVDLSDGSVAWQPSRADLTEVVALGDGRVTLYSPERGELIGYDVASGDRLWQLGDLPGGEYDRVIAAPRPYGYVTSTAPERTVAVDLREGIELWEREETLYPWVFTDGDDTLGLATADGTLSRFDPATGDLLWSRSLTDGRVFVYLLERGLAVPVAADEIWGIAVEDGRVEWNYDLDAPFPVVREQGGSLYTAGTALTSLETSGAASWSRDLPGDGTLYPDVGEEYLVAAAGRTVYGFDLDAAPGGPGDVTGDDRPATDPDGDGDYEDVDGSGGFGIRDVAALINIYDSDAVQNNASAFDYNDDDAVDIVDVATLLGEL